LPDAPIGEDAHINDPLSPTGERQLRPVYWLVRLAEFIKRKMQPIG